MKKLCTIIILVFCITINAQWDVSAGMGINLVNSSSLKEYVNIMRNGDLKDFNTVADFYGTVNYSITDKYQIGTEVGYALFSYDSDYIGKYEISYGIIRPSILFNYVINGEGYKFKFGCGIGLRIINAEESILVTKNELSTLGFGFLLKAEGHTKLSDNLFAVIGVDSRLDFSGELETEDNQSLRNAIDKENVTLGSLSVGLKIGVSYYF